MTGSIARRRPEVARAAPASATVPAPAARHALAALALVATALALVTLAAFAGPALATRAFRPRVGFAMGLIPPRNKRQVEVAVSPSTPVVYHGGSVMRNVRLHTIFWAPNGFHFAGAPGPGTLGYKAMVQQFLTDVAHDSGSAANEFSILTQYHDGTGPGRYQISYDPATDSIDAADSYPARSGQCSSPNGVGTCVTDLELQQEIDRVIARGASGGRGLTDIWFVFLPPDVDECISVGVCGTNAFAGYHSLSNLGHGSTIYVAVPDPLIELTPGPGQDPEGNPDAESTLDTVAHETVEAMTDPVGTAWMDPNGFEVADKCENGPENGPPLGFAADGSPFNQVINGHQYLLQTMWSNPALGCVQSSTDTGSPLPLSTVNLRQFSSSVTGSLSTGAAGVTVGIVFARTGKTVAVASARTRAGGAWGPVTLRARDGRAHAAGDDRDELIVAYGAPGQPPELVETGDGGNPFTESGYTGWFSLDHGYAVRSGRGGNRVLLGPCSQTGVLSLRVGGAFTVPPAQLCETEADAAILSTGRLGLGTPLTMSSQDNRSNNPVTPDGALIKLTIALGEPNSVSALGNPLVLFRPSGFPSCTAFLRIQIVSCSGLVPRASYALRRARGGAVRRARADRRGVVSIGGFPGARGIAGGDALTLSNTAGRKLTTLHVAQMRVDLIGDSTRIASGSCQPGDYYGAPLRKAPISAAVAAPGAGGTGTICPVSGRATGLSAGDIAETDDFSGGQTVTLVPMIESTAPVQDENLFGAFIASAQTGVPGPAGSIAATRSRVSLTIRRAGSKRVVFRARNVDTARGVVVRALAPGSYGARWVLTDSSGDTRTVATRFAEAP
jgi:hypothetical protein